jgi:K+-sensing histidine kinase KdpD
LGLTNGELLERVNLNLVSNAIKYSPNDSRVILKVRVLEGSLLQFSVSNEGPVMPSELASYLFRLYSEGVVLITQKAQGISFGLRFVDVALKRLNSQIEFESSSSSKVLF